jgi:NAD(P)-dependent dehydrogenase (short-subunit alcohol dehydrogenase family)
MELATGIRGKVIVITGGASGIGKATALLFTREGAKVVIVTGHSLKAAEETVNEIKKMGGDAIFVQCDITSEKQVEAMVAKAVERFGRIDFAFNNAGVGPDNVTIPFKPFTELSEADWDKVVDTNLKGVFLCLKHELRQMRKQGSGAIVNTSSTGGIKMMANFGGYGPSKAGVNAITRAAAIENKDLHIRVNAVCPGPTKNTGMSERLLSSMKQTGSKDGAPEGVGDMSAVMGMPDDIARVVIWLCSDDASFINGNVLSVDGGLDIT